MDGISDAAFRFVTKKYGNPDLMFTEFIHVMGMIKGGERLWQDFIFSDLERPICGQIFGAEPEYFYHAAKLVCELGFDGVDINMGCPAKSVAEGGAGAALINTPDLAQEIVRQVRKGVKDWYESDGELTGVAAMITKRIDRMVDERRQRAAALGIEFKRYANGDKRELVPVSVKTRIGFKEIVITDWVKRLTEVEPDWISLHGRTLKQMYTGAADWGAIADGVAATHLPVLANGDIKTHADVTKVLAQTQAVGVLIGRGSYGNPWVFQEVKGGDFSAPSLAKKIEVMLEHARLHTELKGEGAFLQMRKHLGWYASGFDGAVELRKKLVVANSWNEVEEIINELTS